MSWISLCLVFTNRFTNGSFFKFKEKLIFEQQSSLVNKYCCAQCALCNASGFYTGSTNKLHFIRVSEHCGKSYRTCSILKSTGHSAITDHSIKCSHSLNSDNLSIIGSDENLTIFEKFNILKIKTKWNYMQSTFPLKIVIQDNRRYFIF